MENQRSGLKNNDGYTTFYLTLADHSSWYIQSDAYHSDLISRFAQSLSLAPTDEPLKVSTHILQFSSQSNLIEPYLSLQWERHKLNGAWNLSNIESVYFFQEPYRLHSNILYDGPLTDRYLLMMWLLLPIYFHVIKNGGLPLHAALIHKDDQGFVLAGSGSHGKTTSCRILTEPWQAVSDDEALVCASEDGLKVHPMPTWSDYLLRRRYKKQWPTSLSYSLKGILFLEKSNTNSVQPLPPAIAAVRLYQSSREVFNRYLWYCDEKIRRVVVKQLFENAVKIIRQVDAAELHFTKKGGYQEKIEHWLSLQS